MFAYMTAYKQSVRQEVPEGSNSEELGHGHVTCVGKFMWRFSDVCSRQSLQLCQQN